MTSSPLSILACLRIAACSIFAFGIPALMALVIPPILSISSINFSASLMSSLVRLST